MDEHRIAQRHRVLKGGTIAFNGAAGISCTVRNMSQTGAALEVISPLGIPGKFHARRRRQRSVKTLSRGVAEGKADRHRVRLRGNRHCEP